MKIAILAWESLHSIAVGGVAVHASELAKALARKGHQLHFFTRRMQGQRAHDFIDGVHYHRCSYLPHHDFVDDVNNMCRSFVDRFFEIEDFIGNFDIVHAHDWLAANAMIWIKQGRGHKTVLTIHSTEYARCGNSFVNGRSVRVRDQERAGTYWADRVIAVSDATRKEIMWMYNVPECKTVTIHNAVNCERFDIISDPGQDKAKYGIAPLDPTVLFCGRLAWQKGPDILIEAIPAILRIYPNAKFIFAGDGDMRGGLQARAHNLGIMHAVRFVGHKNDDELVRLFKLCDCVCVPSRNEPFGIVVLEAWSASKPVVVTENGGPSEYVRHEIDSLKIYPRPDSVVWGINRIFSDFDRARWMGQNGREVLVGHFTWSKIASLTLDVYRQLSPERAPCMNVPSHEANNGSAVELEAKLMVPYRLENGTANAVLETLKTNLESRGFIPLQKNHHLKVRGGLEEVLDALAECCKRPAPVEEQSSYQEKLLRKVENVCR
jgi:glycosyltransferase involved in cell wall biosynthesis